MSAYLVIQAQVTDWDRFKRYTNVVPAIVKSFGGEYIVMDGSPEIFEGQHKGSVIVSKWTNKVSTKAF